MTDGYLIYHHRHPVPCPCPIENKWKQKQRKIDPSTNRVSTQLINYNTLFYDECHNKILHDERISDVERKIITA